MTVHPRPEPSLVDAVDAPRGVGRGGGRRSGAACSSTTCRRLDPHGSHPADRAVPGSRPAVRPRLGRPVPSSGAARRSAEEVGVRLRRGPAVDSSTSATPTADQTLAARLGVEAPVQRARGSFRRSVTEHQLASLGTIPDGQAKADGLALGVSGAAEVIALRTGDGFRDTASSTPPEPRLRSWRPDGANRARSPTGSGWRSMVVRRISHGHRDVAGMNRLQLIAR